MSYANPEGGVQQAHIHFGQTGVNGGISGWLCSNLASPPAPVTTTETITAANVVGPAAQGIAAGEFAELVAAIRAGRIYANVHSTKFPGGEIRDQIEAGGAGTTANTMMTTTITDAGRIARRPARRGLTSGLTKEGGRRSVTLHLLRPAWGATYLLQVACRAAARDI